LLKSGLILIIVEHNKRTHKMTKITVKMASMCKWCALATSVSGVSLWMKGDLTQHSGTQKKPKVVPSYFPRDHSKIAEALQNKLHCDAPKFGMDSLVRMSAVMSGTGGDSLVGLGSGGATKCVI
jgi:hypothetical protein